MLGRVLAGLALAAAVTSAASAQDVRWPKIEFGRYHALVIGNNDYEHLPRLKTAVVDAVAVAEVLRLRYGFKVKLLVNATRTQILDALNAYRRDLTERDNLLIYYAGHGYLDQETDTGFWLPVDAKSDSDTLWVANADLSRRLRAVAAKHVLVVADSCYSGTLVRGTTVRLRTGSERTAWLERMNTLSSRTALTSGGLEPVMDSGGGNHSVFAKAFLEALRGNDDVLEGHALFRQVSRPVVLNAPDQTPRYSDIKSAGHEGGEFMFVPLSVSVAVTVEPPAPAPLATAVDREIVFWQSIKNSDDPAMFEAYLRRYPQGTFADIAELKIAAAKSKAQLTALVVPPKPEVALDPVEAEFVAVKNANVREEPTVQSAKVGFLLRGERVRVAGRVAGKPWLEVMREGRTLGYVHASLLESVAGGADPTGISEPAVTAYDRDASAVVLPSGLTLLDWTLLAEERIDRGEHRSVLVETKAHERKHGRFRALDTLLDRAAAKAVWGLKIKTIGDAESAFEELARLEKVAGPRKTTKNARRRLTTEALGLLSLDDPSQAEETLALLGRLEAVAGRHPSIVAARDRAVQTLLAGLYPWNRESALKALRQVEPIETRVGKTLRTMALNARSRHLLEEFPAAVDQYRKWLRQAPADHAERKQMARGLTLALKSDVLQTWQWRDCTECPEMVVIPAGSFTMGSPASEKGRYDDEGPQHRVTIPRAFAVSKYEVTFSEWDACARAGGCSYRPGDEGWGRGNRPVIKVNWDDAKAYVQWLSGKTGQEYRLPSEAEWEYAARAGTTTAFHFGDRISPSQANYDGNYSYNGGPTGVYRKRTVAVGSFPTNAFGLHDVHGNVWEWVEDCWNDTYAGAPTDGSAWTTGDCAGRVLRGGSWYNYPRIVRAAVRYRNGTGNRYFDTGFRVARTLP